MQTAAVPAFSLLALVVFGLFVLGGIAAVVGVVVFLSRSPSAKLANNPNLRPCPDCGRFISVRAAACPNCGGPVKGI